MHSYSLYSVVYLNNGLTNTYYYIYLVIIDGYTDTSHRYDLGSGSFQLNNQLACSGNEFRLFHCARGYRDETYHSYFYDWGVTCYNGKTCLPKRYF